MLSRQKVSWQKCARRTCTRLIVKKSQFKIMRFQNYNKA